MFSFTLTPADSQPLLNQHFLYYIRGKCRLISSNMNSYKIHIANQVITIVTDPK